MVDADVLRERLRALEAYVAALAAPRAMPRERFIADADAHDLAERRLHLAIECAIDTANHVIATEGLQVARTYRDSFAVLAEHGVIDAELAHRMGGWAGLRNVLVHLYLDVDHGLVHDAMTDELGDLSDYAGGLRRWLTAQP